MAKSSIEWTGSTWNPIRARNLDTGKVGTWCQKISPGCARCYAEAHNNRNLPHGSSGLPYSAQGGEKAEIFFDPEILAEPLRRRKPEVFFVCSMTDLFQSRHSAEMIAAVWGVMAACSQHTFQVLTKRSERLALLAGGTVGLETFEEAAASAGERHAGVIWDARGAARHLYPPNAGDLSKRRPWPGWPLPNVWLGVSAEREQELDERLPHLRKAPAAIRFLSLEPLLGPIDLGLEPHELKEDGTCRLHCTACFVEKRDGRQPDWVIVGGESGHGARPMHPDWVRSLRDQCVVKQWGHHAPWVDESRFTRGRPERDGNAQVWIDRSGNSGKVWLYDDDGNWQNWTGDRPALSDNNDVNVLGPVGKKKAGRILDGRTWDEMPEVARG